MATIRGFRAERPPKEKAPLVSAVPYDVVNTEEARNIAADNPLSFLHVSRPEIDLPDGADIYSDAVYQKAAENYQKLKSAAPLEIEENPGIYIYRLRMGDHEQTGIAACCSVDEYDSDIIRKHERTRKDKEDDRTRHIITLRAQTGPVFLTYRGRNEINITVEAAKSSEPMCDFTASDGVQHTIWRASESEAMRLIEEFTHVPLLYIADGHHRAASASRARAALAAESPAREGEQERDYFLSALFPADQLRILPYNRIVKDLNGLSADEFLEKLADNFEISETDSASPERKGEICMRLDGRWMKLTIPPDSVKADDPISSLDVSALQDRALDPLLGIKDVRTDKRIDFIGGIRGTIALEQAVSEGRAAAAFSMRPVTVEELMAIADANEIMPPKSTWFEPKLRDGLLSHLI
jgi:uncharacterized protein (DUF1015 family)